MVIAETRAAEAAGLLPLCDDAPRPAGRWSARDNLAHLAAWRDHAASLLESVRGGDAPPVESSDFDEQNGQIFEAMRDMNAAEVRADADRSWDKLSAALEACSDADLRQPRPGRPGQEVWEAVPGNAHLHLAEHLGYLHAEAGDAAAAEAAALWAHELDNRAFPGVSARALAAYNLSCFYARAGRAAEALPHLELAVSFQRKSATVSAQSVSFARTLRPSARLTCWTKGWLDRALGAEVVRG
jgi:tetratricopeptide (TPR) repeat protein